MCLWAVYTECKSDQHRHCCCCCCHNLCVQIDQLLSAREDINASLAGKGKLSVNDFIVKAAALSCKKVGHVAGCKIAGNLHVHTQHVQGWVECLSPAPVSASSRQPMDP